MAMLAIREHFDDGAVAEVAKLAATGLARRLFQTTTSLAILAAILRASSLLSNLAAERRPGSSSK
jgi:hypothetical protein